MSSLKNSFIILLLGLSLACQRNDEQVIKAFFDVDSLISAQAIYLVEQNSDLLKNAYMDGKRDSTFINGLDTIEWKKELEIFHQLDLNNKPINKENYTIENGLSDPESGLFICEYTAKNDQPLSKVKIYYQDNLMNPKKIEGEIVEHNGLYSSIQHLKLTLNESHNQTLLTQYEITGGQRMILGDSVQFKIIGIITSK